MKYGLYVFLFFATMNLHAEIIGTKGTLEDWNSVCEISRAMNMPLINELKETVNSGVSLLFSLSNPEKFITKNLARAKEKIFIEKSCELFVLRSFEEENNNPKIVGFFSFAINRHDKEIAHLSQYGYIEEEISAEDFWHACLQYFFQTKKYKDIKVLFALDLFSTTKCPYMEARRNQIRQFGFTESDDQRAFDFMPFIIKHTTKVLLPTQGHVLDLRPRHNMSKL